MDLVALAVTAFLAMTVSRERQGRQIGREWYATPLLPLLPLGLLVHVDLVLAALAIPLLIWLVAIRSREPLTAPLAYSLLALNCLLVVAGPWDRDWSEAAMAVMVLGLLHLILAVGLHMRAPSVLSTRNNTFLGFGMALLGILMAWGLQPLTTAGLVLLGALTFGLTKKAEITYLRSGSLILLLVAIIKLPYDLWVRDTPLEQAILIMVLVAIPGLFINHFINKDRSQRSRESGG